jgi:hypothetical protein
MTLNCRSTWNRIYMLVEKYMLRVSRMECWRRHLRVRKRREERDRIFKKIAKWVALWLTTFTKHYLGYQIAGDRKVGHVTCTKE